MLQIQRFDPSPCRFPAPSVSILPTLRAGGAACLQLRSNAGARTNHTYARARYALLDAYRRCQIGPTGTLLAPSYHCRTMLDPAIALGADVLFFRLKSDLTPDLTDIEAALAGGQRRVKAVLAAHYFGAVTDFGPLRRLCDAHDAKLIEDCSHVLTLGPQGSAEPASQAGLHGHLAVSSPYKYFPSPEGGLLWSNDGAALPIRDAPTPLRQQLAEVAGSLQQLCRHAFASRTSADDRVHKAVDGHSSADPREWVEPAVGPSVHFDASFAHRPMSRWSRFLVNMSDMTCIAKRRRKHFQEWLSGLDGAPNCRPLWPALPPNCIPYMFPLLLSRPEKDFGSLKHRGIPVWRWDEMAVTQCPVAARYRLQLLHLPCHQSLSHDELRWLIAVTRAALSEPADRAPGVLPTSPNA